MLGETRTSWSGARRGRSSDSARMTHHWSGSAPGTASWASRERAATAVVALPAVGREQLAAQLTDQRREGHRARNVGEGAITLRRNGFGVDDVEIDGRLLVVAADGRHHDPLARPGQGDEQEAGLVVAHRGLGGAKGRGATGDDVDEVLGAEQGPAQPQVRPHALLHPGHDDELPLPTGGSLRRRDGHRLADR